MTVKGYEIEKVHKPPSSRGGVWMGFTTLGILVLFVVIWIPLLFMFSIIGNVIYGFFVFLMVIFFVYATWGYYNMKYIFSPDSLVILWATVTNDIPYKAITRIGYITKNDYGMWKSGGGALPGYYFARFKIKFNVGPPEIQKDGQYHSIKFYGTNRDILVIFTEDQLYGVTPQDVKAFVTDLHEKNPKIKDVKLS